MNKTLMEWFADFYLNVFQMFRYFNELNGDFFLQRFFFFVEYLRMQQFIAFREKIFASKVKQ